MMHGMETLIAFARALLLAVVVGGFVYVGTYWLDDAAWSHVLDIGTSSIWATIMGGIAFTFTFVNEFFFDGELGDRYHSLP